MLDTKGQQLTITSIQDVIDTMSPSAKSDVNGIKDCMKVLLINIPTGKNSTIRSTLLHGVKDILSLEDFLKRYSRCKALYKDARVLV